MSRENTVYAIYYSYVLHRIFSVITGRIDKVLTFCLLLLGSSVMASIGNPLLLAYVSQQLQPSRMRSNLALNANHREYKLYATWPSILMSKITMIKSFYPSTAVYKSMTRRYGHH
ncbi:hypothetical protein SODG_004962 [Sodalis praecaptivus]